MFTRPVVQPSLASRYRRGTLRPVTGLDWLLFGALDRVPTPLNAWSQRLAHLGDICTTPTDPMRSSPL